MKYNIKIQKGKPDKGVFPAIVKPNVDFGIIANLANYMLHTNIQVVATVC